MVVDDSVNRGYSCTMLSRSGAGAVTVVRFGSCLAHWTLTVVGTTAVGRLLDALASGEAMLGSRVAAAWGGVAARWPAPTPFGGGVNSDRLEAACVAGRPGGLLRA